MTQRDVSIEALTLMIRYRTSVPSHATTRYFLTSCSSFVRCKTSQVTEKQKLILRLQVSLVGASLAKNPGFDSAAHELRTCTFHEDAQRQLKSCNHGQEGHDGDAQCGGGGWVPKSLTCRCRGFSPPFHSFPSWPRRCISRGGRQRGRCRRDTGAEATTVVTCPRCSTSRGWYAAARHPRAVGCQGRRNPCPTS
jgi:hypothetical protein